MAALMAAVTQESLPIAARFSNMTLAFLSRSPGLWPSMRLLPLLLTLLREAVSLHSDVASVSADAARFCIVRPIRSDKG